MEEWRDIKGFEGYYQVSSIGRVKSLPRVVTRKSYKPQYLRERILKPGKAASGYLLVDLYKNNNRQTHTIHRLVAGAFNPNPEGKPEVNHEDGNKQNNHKDNLVWSTRIENVEHAVIHGLMPRGEKKPNAVLTVLQVVEICRLIDENGISQSELSRRFNVGSATVSDIHLGNSWDHVTGRKGKLKVSSRKGADHRSSKKVINCRGEVFDTVTEASEKYGVSQTGISRVVRGKRLHAGKYPDGTSIKWKYYDVKCKNSTEFDFDRTNQFEYKDN